MSNAPRAPCILISKRHAFLFLKDEIEKKLGKGGFQQKKLCKTKKSTTVVILKFADFFKRTFFFGRKANVDSIESNKTKKKDCSSQTPFSSL